MESVRGPGTDAGAPSTWRLRVARRVEAAYGPSPNLAVVAVAGSVGAGFADRWSDLEIDCYWWEPPTDSERRTPIGVLGAEVTAFWDYDDEDEEWSEDYQLGALPVTVSNFTVATAERFLDAVLNDLDLDPVKHYRLAAIGVGRALRGEAVLSRWRERSAAYPEALVRSVVDAALSPERFPGWTAREALAERGDVIAVRSLVSAIAQGVFGAVLAVNRVFRPHRLPKWQRQLLGGLTLTPDRFGPRMEELWDPSPLVALSAAENLVHDTIEWAERASGLDFGGVRVELAERRRPVDPPSVP